MDMEEVEFTNEELCEILKDNDFSEVYCVCRMPADDDMIACHNINCEFEWFHIECVGLTNENIPTKWFCDACKEQRKVKNKFAHIHS